MSFETNCSCGRGVAGFNFKDEIMSEKVISNLYCPRCSSAVTFRPETMLSDNGWIIEYDMDIARFQSHRLKTKPRNFTPDFIFDSGYCTWRGIYPSDHIDSVLERTEIVQLAKISPKKYLEEIKEWAQSRVARLAEEGWRKAGAAKGAEVLQG